MNVLVAGADRVDAGKTTFSTGLVAYLDATGFKPRAGNDYWFHHDDYHRAISDGRLYGKDARRLAATSPGDVEPEELNPVHRLWRPTPGTRGLLGRVDKQFLVDRIRGVPGAVPGTDRYVVNGTADLPESARAALPLDGAEVVHTLEEFNDLMASWHAPALSAIAEEIRTADRAVIESYGDVADPLGEIGYAGAAVVEPTRVRIYDGERYRRACDAVGGTPEGGRLEERVDRVVDLLEPAATEELPALEADRRTDPTAVAEAYESAFEAIESVANGE